jgi:peptide deformylase
MQYDPQKCEITRYPSSVLAKKAQPVKDINDNIRQIAEKMIEIMVETHGIGLAAPQAGLPLRMFVISLDGSKENAKVYINPQIKPSGKLEPSPEGCLSIPGLEGKIKRYTNCSVTAQDLDGNTFTEDAQGLHARALQHEYDHLEGTMIKDRLSQVAKISARKTLKKLEQDFEQDQ